MIAKTEKSRMLICGTHAFKPRCRHYKYKVIIITHITIITVIITIANIVVIVVITMSEKMPLLKAYF